MGNEYFMGGFRPNSYAPSYLSTQMAPQANNTTNIVWTMGLESAKAYPLLPGRTIMLMDSESPHFFIKAVDANGYATIKSYTFQEEPQSSAPTANYVTKEQLDAALAAVIEELRQKAPEAVHKTEETKVTKNLL